MGFLWFGKKKEEKTLEEMAKDAAIKLGVRYDPSFNNPSYFDFNIIGTGDSEDDSKGALEHFRHNLVHGKYGLPEIVSKIKEDLIPRDLYGRSKKRISALGYKPNSHSPAA